MYISDKCIFPQYIKQHGNNVLTVNKLSAEQILTFSVMTLFFIWLPAGRDNMLYISIAYASTREEQGNR